MKEYSKICPICGKSFTANQKTALYCSALCRKVGQDQARKAWQERTDYKAKQRERMRSRRQKQTAEARQALQETRSTASSKLLEDLRASAATHTRPGNSTAEYWEAWRAYQIAYSEAQGYRSDSEANGVSVRDPGFVEKVLFTIEELGSITTTSKHGEALE